MDLDLTLTIYLCFWLAALGAVLGSFLDCAVSRWARGESWVRGRSRCDSCAHTLGARELIPVFSFLLGRGRCRHCGARIPADCLWAELAGAAGFVCLGVRFGLSAELGQWLVLAGLLLALSLTDAAERIIPDKLLLAAAANRAVWFFILGQEPWPTVRGALLSLVIPAALLLLVLAVEKLLGREAMGGGDIKLLAVLALYLQWPELVLALLVGCLLGIAGAAAGRKGGAIPFGPFLAAAALLCVCFGAPVLEWYLSFFR